MARKPRKSRRKYLGYHSCKHKAAEVYNEAAKIYHKEFAHLNIIKKEQ